MTTSQHITLTQLQTLIKQRLADAFPLSYWVAAEISELKVNYSGHCYLELVEKGGANQVPQAKCSAVIWRSTYTMLSGYFSTATGTPLSAGSKVLLRVSVNYHELYGLSLQVNDIDPAYTLGDMEQQRLATIRQLQEDGVFDMNREIGLPVVVQRVAVVSSRNAAGYQDFMNELSNGIYRFETELFDAFMQGGGAEDSIIGALERISDRADEFDVVIMIRGGGSQSDLSCFNSYRLCSHVAQFPVPVVTGIGHDKDRSVADLVAAESLKTPTAVATWLIERAGQFDSYLNGLEENIAQIATGLVDVEKQRLHRNGYMLNSMAVQLTRGMEMRIEKLASELLRRQQGVTIGMGGRLDRLAQRLADRSSDVLARQQRRLEMFESVVQSRRPDKILSMGFAIVRKNGHAVSDSVEFNKGDDIEIVLARGGAQAKIEKIYGKDR